MSFQAPNVGLMPVKPPARRLVRLRQLSMLPHTHPRLFMGSARTPRHAPAPASLPPGDEMALLEQAYDDTPRETWPLAEHQLRAHLVRLGVSL